VYSTIIVAFLRFGAIMQTDYGGNYSGTAMKSLNYAILEPNLAILCISLPMLQPLFRKARWYLNMYVSDPVVDWVSKLRRGGQVPAPVDQFNFGFETPKDAVVMKASSDGGTHANCNGNSHDHGNGNGPETSLRGGGFGTVDANDIDIAIEDNNDIGMAIGDDNELRYSMRDGSLESSIKNLWSSTSGSPTLFGRRSSSQEDIVVELRSSVRDSVVTAASEPTTLNSEDMPSTPQSAIEEENDQ
jgi:hypothetical protein